MRGRDWRKERQERLKESEMILWVKGGKKREDNVARHQRNKPGSFTFGSRPEKRRWWLPHYCSEADCTAAFSRIRFQHWESLRRSAVGGIATSQTGTSETEKCHVSSAWRELMTVSGALHIMWFLIHFFFISPGEKMWSNCTFPFPSTPIKTVPVLCQQAVKLG